MKLLAIFGPLLCLWSCPSSAFTAYNRMPRSTARVMRIRGGSSSAVQPEPQTEVQVTVRSAMGSKWLDRHCTLRVDARFTVKQLKDSVQNTFPGKPPATLQRLFLQSRLLRDNERVSALVEDGTGRLALVLDWLPLSTSQYSSAGATVDELLAASVALRAAIQFASQMANTLADPEQSGVMLSSPEPMTAVLKKQVESETKLLPEVFKDQLAVARAKQANPVEHAQYNENTPSSLGPALRAVLRYVDLDRDTLQRNAMYSLLLMSALITRVSSQVLLVISLLPFLQLFQPVRYWLKVVRYLLPPLQGHQLTFFQPILSPTGVSILRWSGVWDGVPSGLSAELEDDRSEASAAANSLVDDVLGDEGDDFSDLRTADGSDLEALSSED